MIYQLALYFLPQSEALVAEFCKVIFYILILFSTFFYLFFLIMSRREPFSFFEVEPCDVVVRSDRYFFWHSNAREISVLNSRLSLLRRLARDRLNGATAEECQRRFAEAHP